MSVSEPGIVVTGATGLVGSEVVRSLAADGVACAAAVRNPGSYEAPSGAARVTARAFDFQDPSTYAAVFRGARRLFLVRPPAISDVERWILPAVDAALDAGVEHVVFLSLLGAEKNSVVPHRTIEDHLLELGEESALGWTFLRASFFMQNLITTHRSDIRDRDEIVVPAGRGRTSFIDVRDIGAVGARALVEPGHGGRAYDLTGAEALTYGEVAEILSDVLGRPIEYDRPGLIRFVVHMRRQGHAWPFVLVMAGIYTTARLGLADRVTGDVAEVLGRSPTSFRRFAEDYRDAWIR